MNSIFIYILFDVLCNYIIRGIDEIYGKVSVKILIIFFPGTQAITPDDSQCFHITK